ncbi:MAG: hypothetical protein JSU86_07100, partial [Phycisphaerales bacterium]
MDLPGVIVLCNNDDDNEDGVKDNTGPNAETIDNGPYGTDGDDLAQVVLRAMPTLADGASVTLTLQDATNVASGVNAQAVVRVFTGHLPDSGTQVILGGGSTGPTVFPLPEDDATHEVDLAGLRAGDVSLWVEGLEFAAEVKLEMEVNDGAGSTCSDQIQLKVAPLILIGHLQDALQSFTSRIGGDPEIEAESTAYTIQRFPDAMPPGILYTIIVDPDNSGDDPWAQDEFQIGFQEAPYGAMYVVLDSKRDGQEDVYPFTPGLKPFPLTLLGPEFGHIQVENGIDFPNSLDSFGNLEVSPPCVVQGTEYPLGRLYYGDGGPGGRQMDADLRQFLSRQTVQETLTLNSDWLLVGHVDEFMSIAPNPNATHGWSVLLADPVLALDILSGDTLVVGGVDEKLHIPKYNEPPAPYGVEQLGALLGRTTSDGTMTIEEYNASTSPVASTLQDLKAQVEQAFDLQTSEDFYPVPVLFDYVDDPDVGSGAVAITPNLVNSSVYGTTFIAPDPFLHSSTEEDGNANYRLDVGEDTNGNYMLDTLRDPF